jgi:flagellar basal body-associated protein FliL
MPVAAVAAPSSWLLSGVVAQLGASTSDDASSRLSMVIAGLVVLAILIAVATVVFWRMTRPDRNEEAPGLRWVPPTEGGGPFTTDSAPPDAGTGRRGDPGPPTAG